MNISHRGAENAEIIFSFAADTQANFGINLFCEFIFINHFYFCLFASGRRDHMPGWEGIKGEEVLDALGFNPRSFT
jgi:hypothetical protein